MNPTVISHEPSANATRQQTSGGIISVSPNHLASRDYPLWAVSLRTATIRPTSRARRLGFLTPEAVKDFKTVKELNEAMKKAAKPGEKPVPLIEKSFLKLKQAVSRAQQTAVQAATAFFMSWKNYLFNVMEKLFV